MRGVVGEATGEQLDQAVVEGQHAVGLGLVPPALDQLGQLLGVRGGEVVALRGVGGEVVELPRRRRRRRCRPRGG